MKITELTNNLPPRKENGDYYDYVQTVLANRGVDNVEDFFNLSWESVNSPYNLENIQLAADKVLHHLRHSERIAIEIDADCDGITSSSILRNYFQACVDNNFVGENGSWSGNYPEIVYLQHEDKSHGLADTTIMRALRDTVKPQLLIIPDASGTNEQYKALTDLGIDIVVLDHHDTEEKGDNDKVIVVNCQHSPKYTNKAMSGAGIVWQFCRVLDDILGLDLADMNLDLVAVGLVADVMDMRDPETRFLIMQGLSEEQVMNPLLNYCLFANEYFLQGSLNPKKVGFNIAPLFNAIVRIGSMDEKDILFDSLAYGADTTMVPSGNRNQKGQEVPLVAEAYRQINNAKARQTRKQNKMMELIDNYIHEQDMLEDKVIIVALDQGDYEPEYRGLAGLVCNKLQELYQRPVSILFENEDGSYSGSFRAPSGFEVFENFKDQCAESGFFNYAAGHQQAGGLSIDGDVIMDAVEYFNNKYAETIVEPSYYVDFIFDASDVEAADVILELAEYSGIWGTGIKEPLIAIKNVPITRTNTQIVGAAKGKPTLKIGMKNGVVAIKFKSSQEELDSLLMPHDEKVESYRNITIIGKPERNEFRGEVTPQILVEDYSIDGVAFDF